MITIILPAACHQMRSSQSKGLSRWQVQWVSRRVSVGCLGMVEAGMDRYDLPSRQRYSWRDKLWCRWRIIAGTKGCLEPLQVPSLFSAGQESRAKGTPHCSLSLAHRQTTCTHIRACLRSLSPTLHHFWLLFCVTLHVPPFWRWTFRSVRRWERRRCLKRVFLWFWLSLCETFCWKWETHRGRSLRIWLQVFSWF